MVLKPTTNAWSVITTLIRWEISETLEEQLGNRIDLPQEEDQFPNGTGTINQNTNPDPNERPEPSIRTNCWTTIGGPCLAKTWPITTLIGTHGVCLFSDDFKWRIYHSNYLRRRRTGIQQQTPCTFNFTLLWRYRLLRKQTATIHYLINWEFWNNHYKLRERKCKMYHRRSWKTS